MLHVTDESAKLATLPEHRQSPKPALKPSLELLTLLFLPQLPSVFLPSKAPLTHTLRFPPPTCLYSNPQNAPFSVPFHDYLFVHFNAAHKLPTPSHPPSHAFMNSPGWLIK